MEIIVIKILLVIVFMIIFFGMVKPLAEKKAHLSLLKTYKEYKVIIDNGLDSYIEKETESIERKIFQLKIKIEDNLHSKDRWFVDGNVLYDDREKLNKLKLEIKQVISEAKENFLIMSEFVVRYEEDMEKYKKEEEKRKKRKKR